MEETMRSLEPEVVREVVSDYMLTNEVAKERRIPVETLRYWRANDEGPRSFKIGRRVVYRRSEIDAWFAQQEAATSRGGDAL